MFENKRFMIDCAACGLLLREYRSEAAIMKALRHHRQSKTHYRKTVVFTRPVEKGDFV